MITSLVHQEIHSINPFLFHNLHHVISLGFLKFFQQMIDAKLLMRDFFFEK